MGYGPSRGWGSPDTGVRALRRECGPGGVQPVDNRQAGVPALPTPCGPGSAQPVDLGVREVTVTGSDRLTVRHVGVGMGGLLGWGAVAPTWRRQCPRGENRSGPGATRYVTVC